MKHKFSFSPHIRDTGLNLTPWQMRQLVQELPSPLYFVRPKRRYLWNVELIRHLYLVCDGDRNHPEHKKIVEEFLSTLPKTA